MLVAYQRPAPIVARADQSLWPGVWLHDATARTITPTAPGRLVFHIALAGAQRYELWLGGSFARGFQVSVDGRPLGNVSDQLQNIGQYVSVGALELAAGIHVIALQYPRSGAAPGSGAAFTTLSALALEPLDVPATGMITTTPRTARELCGRTLDWIEIVRQGLRESSLGADRDHPWRRRGTPDKWPIVLAFAGRAR